MSPISLIRPISQLKPAIPAVIPVLMITLTVNGKAGQYEDVRTAGDLLGALGIARERVALMVNGDVVKRAELDATPLRDGDAVEVITMVGGG